MLWLLFGILTAVFFSMYYLLARKLSIKIEPAQLSFIGLVMLSVMSLPLLFVFHNQIILNSNTVAGLFVTGLLVAVSRYYHLKSLGSDQISKTVPLLSLSPIITVPFAFVLVGELPTMPGFIGIVIATVGVYTLNLRHVSRKDILGPFKQLMRNKASRYMLYVVVIYGFGAAIDKFIIVNGNVMTRLFLGFYFALAYTGIGTFLTHGKQFFHRAKAIIRQSGKYIALLALIHFCALVFQFTGISLTITAYIIVFKRASAVIAIIGAYFIFKEKQDFRNSIIGTILLIIGVILLTL